MCFAELLLVDRRTRHRKTILSFLSGPDPDSTTYLNCTTRKRGCCESGGLLIAPRLYEYTVVAPYVHMMCKIYSSLPLKIGTTEYYLNNGPGCGGGVERSTGSACNRYGWPCLCMVSITDAKSATFLSLQQLSLPVACRLSFGAAHYNTCMRTVISLNLPIVMVDILPARWCQAAISWDSAPRFQQTLHT